MQDSSVIHQKLTRLSQYGGQLAKELQPFLVEEEQLTRPNDLPYLHLVQMLLKQHQLMLAYDLTTTAVAHYQSALQTNNETLLQKKQDFDHQTEETYLKLTQYLGLIFNKFHMPDKAQQVFLQLVDLGHNDEETLGNLASSYKILALQSSHIEKQQQLFYQAYQGYHQAYKLNNSSYWTGINAATLSFFLGDTITTKLLADDLTHYCQDQLKPDTTDYWLYATWAEVCCLRYLLDLDDDFESLIQAYRQACEKSLDYLQIASSRKNLELILKQQHKISEEPAQRLLKVLYIPPVTVFSGHITDSDDRINPRFSPAHSEKIKSSLKQIICQTNTQWGYASAACGSDILFAETMAEYDRGFDIVLPMEKTQFIKSSVAIRTSVKGEDAWVQRFNDLLSFIEQQENCHLWYSSMQSLNGHALFYRYCNGLIYGLAKWRSKQIGCELMHLAVLAASGEMDIGGTEETVNWWRQQGHEVTVINPLDLETSPYTLSALEEPETHLFSDNQVSQNEEEDDISFRAIIFTDTVGYSKFTEEQVLIYHNVVLKELNKLIPDKQVETRNTWGDALFLIFSDLEQAGHCALRISHWVNAVQNNGEWQKMGLPDTFQMRIALHYGPVFSTYDAIQQQGNFVGNHISNTARIEPITPPGEVYASLAASAFIEVLNITSLRCDYIGQVPLSKNYGVYSLFRLRLADSEIE